MNSKLDFLIRKNKGKLFFQSYLKELQALIFDFDERDVLSLEKSDDLRNQKLLFQKCHYLRKISFSDKNHLKEVLENLSNKYRGKILVSTSYSEFCGFGIMANLTKFNYNFNFDDEASGLIVLYSESFKNKLIIDFYEENNQYLYDIEIWCEITESKN